MLSDSKIHIASKVGKQNVMFQK